MAYVKADEVGIVVTTIIRECVDRPLAIGGVATNMGKLHVQALTLRRKSSQFC